MIDESGKPPILYRYSDVGVWLDKFFNGDSLQFSSRTKFNDPFDCRPGFRAEDSASARQKLRDGLRGRGMSPAKSLIRANQSMRRFQKSENLRFARTEDFLDQVGVLCLTPRWDNSLMWSHYGNHHRGIRVGFHSNIDIFRVADRVQYADMLPVIPTPVQPTMEMYEKVFLRKAKFWEYEEEWRIIKPNMDDDRRDEVYRGLVCDYPVSAAKIFADQRGPGIYRFDKSAISEVILGMKISSYDLQKVASGIKKAGLKIPIYKISPPAFTYSLSRKQFLQQPGL